MSKLKVATFGFRGTTDQLSRVEKGLVELGHEISYDDPTIIFSNNPSYEEPIAFSKKWPRAKKIFTVLDVPIHVNSYPFDLIRNQLLAADAVCSISHDTAKEVKRVYGFDSHVIYTPRKETYRIPDIKKEFFCIFSGRANDSNKRFHLVTETIQKLGKTPDDLHIVGTENPGWGIHHGVVDDYQLNDLYNRAKYYICATQYAGGIQLGPIESQFCGCIPIVTNDLTTYEEFFSHCPSAAPDPDELAQVIKNVETNRMEISQELIKSAPIQYSRLNYLEVAKSILDIYRAL